jgi:putative two-component system response regulator
MRNEKPVILVVDDTPDNLAFARDLLKEEYKVKVAISGAKALSIIEKDPPDLILLDIMMPQMDGYEVCRRLKAQPKFADIPVIFLTAKSDAEDEQMGLAIGAVDYLIKPLSPPILMARLKTHLSLKRAQDFLKDHNQYLEAEVARRIKEISLIQEVLIVALASLAETRDNETGAHVQRTREYIWEIAHYLQKKRLFPELLTSENINLMVKSAPLHDIGKVGVPDHILLKPAALTFAEFEIMKTHTTLGWNAICKAEALLEKQSETFLHFAKEIAYSHHEKWNGSGYPEGISRNKIPIVARIMAIADVYDALTSDRVYKKAFPHDRAVSIIKEESGTHFDPVIVGAFLALADRFQEIAAKYRDHV